MKNDKPRHYGAALLFVSLVLASCTFGKQILPSPAEPSQLTGIYTVFLYGCHYPDDAMNVAILISDGIKYSFEIYDLDTSYKTIRALPAEQALRQADTFLHCSTHRVWRTEVRRIPDDSGGTVGYEVRPLYLPYEFGQPDILLTSYSLREGTIRAYIKLDPDIQRAIEAPGPGDSSHEHD